MTRDEVAAGLEWLIEKTEGEYPEIALILYTVLGSLRTGDERSLADLSILYAKAALADLITRGDGR